VCRSKKVIQILLFDKDILIIMPGDYGSRMMVLQNSLGDAVNSPNTFTIFTLEWFDFIAS